jgi:uncharacterized protein (DUF2062 family)
MKDYLKQYLPSPDELQSNRFLRMFGPALVEPGVWRLTRRSVAGGVATGMFCGLLPAPFQSICAALVAILTRVNLPVAVFTTFYTNPLTFIPLYLIGLEIGLSVFGLLGIAPEGSLKAGEVAPPPPFDLAAPLDSFGLLISWLVSLGWPLLVGVFLLAVILAVVGYTLVYWGWAFKAMRDRARRRQQPQRAMLVSELESRKDRSHRAPK